MVTQQLPLPIGEYGAPSFENYYLADSNRELVAAVERCGQGEGERFLYLWGPSGVGKTHLLLAACQAAAQRGERVAYVPLKRAAIMAPEILRGLEAAALVAIDDIDRIAGCRYWEESLLHLYNLSREGPSQLLLASSKKPGALPLLLPDLRSRLGWGLVYQLQPLDDHQKHAALKLQAAKRGMELPDEVAAFLLRHSDRDMHSLSDLLAQLERASMAAQRRLTIPFARQVLGIQLR
ncbi:DnaA regulatory inactivator Hda [Nitrosococcus halophilus Nc 4]|uniref:DnaA regulatory inactivator Hda n=1 Tax=Nitrosococcus halophilus (strain Nc4) TaxID=472759 RepID=D5BY69_NITHN|nr:DnaA regulatory inactivator Hda [Nitrosococcus halophilus]ADE14052.1 DnaA regulatory inactivator Hda [Nitrosococcus halophilus Nc 4]